MKTLIIDNYDSFTYNLFQLIAQVNGIEPLVIYNDSNDFYHLTPKDYDNIVLSPGPGHPDCKEDFGICRTLILESPKPILGVCLGHQGIFSAFGGKVLPAQSLMHGRSSTIHHTNHPLYDHIPHAFQVTRYHSYICAPAVPQELSIIAWSSDQEIMSLCHRSRPLWGVQFHPESLTTEYGEQLLRNFQKLSAEFYTNIRHVEHRKTSPKSSIAPISEILHCVKGNVSLNKCREIQLQIKKLDFYPDPLQVFQNVYAKKEYAVWLDSSQIIDGFSRFSYMGCLEGPLAHHIQYQSKHRSLKVTDCHTVAEQTISIFDYLKQQLQQIKISMPQDVPFDFHGGWIGYLGYELNQETASINSDKSSEHPDAQFIFLDRYLVFDHQEQACYLVLLSSDPEPLVEWAAEICFKIKQNSEADVSETNFPETDILETDVPRLDRGIQRSCSMRKTIAQMKIDLDPAVKPRDVSFVENINYQQIPQKSSSSPPITGTWIQSQPEYLAHIQDCLQHIARGESYEICLTNKLQFATKIHGLDYYKKLRTLHPSPHAAFLKFPTLDIACSSMERFLAIDRQRKIQAKPIKGTTPRDQNAIEDQALARSLQEDEKFRSEHLMIVDLLRNDLGKVCEIGTVNVPKFMAVETYATVHQLISVIEGQLPPHIDMIDCIRNIFPGGSMTGAPKIRTMNIINQMERHPRGIYSGSIGYLSLNGCMDLNIVIRTAEITETDVQIGAGGALIALSDPHEEWEEIVLKTQALQKAFTIK